MLDVMVGRLDHAQIEYCGQRLSIRRQQGPWYLELQGSTSSSAAKRTIGQQRTGQEQPAAAIGECQGLKYCTVVIVTEDPRSKFPSDVSSVATDIH